MTVRQRIPKSARRRIRRLSLRSSLVTPCCRVLTIVCRVVGLLRRPKLVLVLIGGDGLAEVVTLDLWGLLVALLFRSRVRMWVKATRRRTRTRLSRRRRRRVDRSRSSRSMARVWITTILERVLVVRGRVSGGRRLGPTCCRQRRILTRSRPSCSCSCLRARRRLVISCRTPLSRALSILRR